MKTTKTATQIATEINNAGEKHYGEKAKAWESENVSRIYFGRDFVTIEKDGEIHNRKNGKARALSIGDSAVELVEAHA